MRALAVVNPAAAAGRSARQWPRRKKALARLFPDLKERFTERPGHGVELARAAFEKGFERVIAVGGDGTFREAVDGYLRAASPSPEAALVCFPAGSGCDFARHQGTPQGDAAALDALSRGRVRRVDAIHIAMTGDDGAPLEWHHVNMAAFGLGGDVTRAMLSTGKPLGGTLSYLLVTLAHIARSTPRGYELKLDGKVLAENEFHTVILANTSSTGGGMKVAPQADCEDGRFEVLTLGNMSRLRMLAKFPKIYAGTHLGEEGITVHQAAKLEARQLDADGPPAWLNIDGEAVGRLPATFTLKPRSVPVLFPG